MTEPLLSEISRPGRIGHHLPDSDVPPAEESLPAGLLREALDLPEVSENEVVRHFVHLSHLNYGLDTGFYPLGSCTMKYNPKMSEEIARWPGFSAIHPLQAEESVQGALRLMYELQRLRGEISGLRAVSLQPAAGAHGELTGMLMIRAYHESRGDRKRTKVLIPDSAHGTNPATATMCGYSTVPVRSDARGNVDLEALSTLVDGETAALMLTMPNTLGLFDENMLAISETVHGCGALMYGDGANMNAMLGVAKPADLGFDVLHINLHKTFATPHGGGGPGAGVVAAREMLEQFLPVPFVVKTPEGRYSLNCGQRESIGQVRSFYGSFGVLVRAYAYIRALGAEGLRKVGENAILNANYLRTRLQQAYEVPYPRSCMHEFVLSGSRQKAQGVRTLDIAKRLIDFGFYPPTVYFPLIVEEAMMVEPTETESRETL
ncbi:MAG TPA: aminomethyl-transferring glycine dehydrogenase subunit GcvPB, partial [Chloroflexota bacterium]|nr:aminomethyl-transferring glycine dehydrogenase subunit GcvPB [Chloroflexota bacterium]